MTQKDTTSLSLISRSRLECLSDGIFAIAMTLLVLELRVPDIADRHSIDELARALGHNATTFASYILSFLMLGIFWYRHNKQYHHLKVITRSVLALQFVQLAAAAFFPFCAALLGRYPTNALSIVIYTGCGLVYTWATFANWVAARRSGALGPEVVEANYLLIRKKLFRTSLRISIAFAFMIIFALFR
jgi:uncharacterized membrane protein